MGLIFDRYPKYYMSTADVLYVPVASTFDRVILVKTKINFSVSTILLYNILDNGVLMY